MNGQMHRLRRQAAQHGRHGSGQSEPNLSATRPEQAVYSVFGTDVAAFLAEGLEYTSCAAQGPCTAARIAVSLVHKPGKKAKRSA